MLSGETRVEGRCLLTHANPSPLVRQVETNVLLQTVAIFHAFAQSGSFPLTLVRRFWRTVLWLKRSQLMGRLRS